MSTLRQAMICVLASIPLACWDAPESAVSPELITVAAKQSVDLGGGIDRNERLARISDVVPGFGGLFVDNGQLVVRLKDPTADLGPARAAVSELLAAETKGGAEAAALRRTAADDLVARPADYSYRQLLEWYGLIRRQLPANRFSTGDISNRLNRVVIGVPDDASISVVEALIVDLQIDPEAVVVERRGRFVLHNRASTSLQGTVSPRVGGARINRTTSATTKCTLGFSVDRPEDSHWYFVTASHCSDEVAAMNSDSIGQPNINTLLGFEVHDPPFFTSADSTQCDPNNDCRWADASLYRYTTSDRTHGEVAWPGSPSTSWGTAGSINFTNTKQIGNEFDALEGDEVQMIGSETGRSIGDVIADCAEVDVGDYLLVCADKADYYGQRGDSGAPVVYFDATRYEFKWVAVGIHTGAFEADSITVFSTTTAWQNEFEWDDTTFTHCVTVYCSPDPVASISGPVRVPPNVTCTWTSSVSSGVSPYSYSWSGVLSGSSADITGTVSSSGWLNLTVTDDVGHTDDPKFYVVVDSQEPMPPGCSF